MQTCLGAQPAAPRVLTCRAAATRPALPVAVPAVAAAQANEHYEPPCGTPRHRARPEA
jgi:hypothetical protein